MASYTLVGAVIVLGGIGYTLDQWTESAPWFLVAGLIVSVSGSTTLQTQCGGADVAMHSATYMFTHRAVLEKAPKASGVYSIFTAKR